MFGEERSKCFEFYYFSSSVWTQNLARDCFGQYSNSDLSLSLNLRLQMERHKIQEKITDPALTRVISLCR